MTTTATLSDLKFNINLRVYGYEVSSHLSHGYCVGDTPTGLSHIIGKFQIDIRTITLKQMRHWIQYDLSSNMFKRSKLFQEALCIFSKLPNLYNRPKEQLTSYAYGFVSKDGLDVKLITKKQEMQPICELLNATDIFAYDLCLIPYSQLSKEHEEHVNS